MMMDKDQPISNEMMKLAMKMKMIIEQQMMSMGNTPNGAAMENKPSTNTPSMGGSYSAPAMMNSGHPNGIPTGESQTSQQQMQGNKPGSSYAAPPAMNNGQNGMSTGGSQTSQQTGNSYSAPPAMNNGQNGMPTEASQATQQSGNSYSAPPAGVFISPMGGSQEQMMPNGGQPSTENKPGSSYAAPPSSNGNEPNGMSVGASVWSQEGSSASKMPKMIVMDPKTMMPAAMPSNSAPESNSPQSGGEDSSGEHDQSKLINLITQLVLQRGQTKDGKLPIVLIPRAH